MGMNSAGATQPVLGMPPAQERLHALDLARDQVHHRLVVDEQLVPGQRAAQPALQAQPLHRLRVHGGA